MPSGEIRRDSGCFDYDAAKQAFKVFTCHGQHGNQQWQLQPVSQSC